MIPPQQQPPVPVLPHRLLHSALLRCVSPPEGINFRLSPGFQHDFLDATNVSMIPPQQQPPVPVLPHRLLHSALLRCVSSPEGINFRLSPGLQHDSLDATNVSMTPPQQQPPVPELCPHKRMSSSSAMVESWACPSSFSSSFTACTIVRERERERES